jgi:hypothetical protein
VKKFVITAIEPEAFMPAPDLLARILKESDLPLNHCDFATQAIRRVPDHAELMVIVGKELKAKNPDQVLNGLSNVLYWLQQLNLLPREAIYDMRTAVRGWMLVDAIRLFDHLSGPGLVPIASLKLSGFDKLMPATALRMFLDPGQHALITPRLLGLRGRSPRISLHDLPADDAMQPVALQLEGCMSRWSQSCRHLNGTGAGLASLALDLLLARGEGDLVWEIVLGAGNHG